MGQGGGSGQRRACTGVACVARTAHIAQGTLAERASLDPLAQAKHIEANKKDYIDT